MRRAAAPSTMEEGKDMPMKMRSLPKAMIGLVALAALSGRGTEAAWAAQVRCQQQVNITGALVAGDATEAVRMFRGDPGSACASGKVCPGTSATGPFFYDTYAFRNGASDACVTATLTNHCGASTFVHASAFAGGYDPANLCSGYLGDVGSSPVDGAAASFSFTVPAGQTLVMVVNATTASAECPEYDLQLAGCSGWGAVWSAAGSAGVPANPGAVVFAGPAVQLKSTTALRVSQTIRYGVPGLKLDPDGFWQVRFRDNGASARLRVWLKHADTATGAQQTLMSFDSNLRPASAGFQLVEIPTSSVTVPATGACWIEATLDKTGGTGNPALHSLGFIAP
jgi:hypothetical protein